MFKLVINKNTIKILEIIKLKQVTGKYELKKAK